MSRTQHSRAITPPNSAVAAGANRATAEEPQSEAPSPSVLLQPTIAEVLLEQYKLLEERRKYFGTQFMQTIGGVLAIFSLLVGLLGGSADPNYPILRASLPFGGVAFLLLAYLAHRLGARQDDCEHVMHEIESILRSSGYRVVSVRRGAERFGARVAIVVSLAFAGAALLVVGVLWENG